MLRMRHPDIGCNRSQSSTEAGATDPLSVKSKLETPLIVIPEHQKDYIQFALGKENFDSTQHDQTALSWCSTGGWDPSQGPTCGRVSAVSVGVPSPSDGLILQLMSCLCRNDRWTATSSVHGMGESHLMARDDESCWLDELSWVGVVEVER